VVGATAWWWHQSEAVTSLAARRREELQRKRLQKEAGPTKRAQRLAYREVKVAKNALRRPVVPGEYDRPIGAPEATPATALEPVGVPPPAE
jgi:hypothetical protein